MGARLAVVCLLVFLALAAIAALLFFNISVFCRDRDQIDLGFYKISCKAIPDKRAELDMVLDRTCYIFRTDYNCSIDLINRVNSSYQEFGRETRVYTLTELCSLKNLYSTVQQCASSCGCAT